MSLVSIKSIPYKVILNGRAPRCLKDGTLVESGTHSELLALDGEYAKLYNIQAGAFSDGEKTAEES